MKLQILQRRVIWEYEFASDEGLIWVPEDDERTASYKAINETGRIRSREIITIALKTRWRAKRQTLI